MATCEELVLTYRSAQPGSAQPGPAPQQADGRVRRVRAALVVLFPETPERGTLQLQPEPQFEPGHADAARSAGRRAVYVTIQVAAVCIGTIVLLLRIAGIPAWDSVYAEDQGVWLFASSEILALIYAPLVLLRVVALPRWREHAVTAGWLAGLLVQVPVVLESYAQHTSASAGQRLWPCSAWRWSRAAGRSGCSSPSR